MNLGSLTSEPVLKTLCHHMLPPVLQTDIGWNWEEGRGGLEFCIRTGIDLEVRDNR